MSDIFISYSHKDKAVAANFAQLFKDNGWTVFWDKQIPPGQTYDQYIKKQLEQSRCIVVLWSDSSVASDWVKEEASRGISQSKLVPVLIEQIEPPLGFGRIEAAELYHWSGSAKDPDQQAELANLLQAITTMMAPSVSTDAAILSTPLPISVGLVAVPEQSSQPSADIALPLKQSRLRPKQAVIVTCAIAAVAAIAAIAPLILKGSRPPITHDPAQDQRDSTTMNNGGTKANKPPQPNGASGTGSGQGKVEPGSSTDKDSPDDSRTDDNGKTPSIPPPDPSIGTISGDPGLDRLKNLRSGPGTKYSVVKQVAIGEKVEILGISNDVGGYHWVRVRTSDGVEAWIAEQLITTP